jgi:hypothetical protein
VKEVPKSYDTHANLGQIVLSQLTLLFFGDKDRRPTSERVYNVYTNNKKVPRRSTGSATLKCSTFVVAHAHDVRVGHSTSFAGDYNKSFGAHCVACMP